MRKNIVLYLISLSLLMLVGCNQQNESLIEESEINDEEAEVKNESLIDNEVYLIVSTIYNSIDEEMLEIQAEHSAKWQGNEYIQEFDMDNEGTTFAYNLLSEVLHDYFTEENLKAEEFGIIHTYLLEYFSYLIQLSPFHENVLEYGFKLLEQDTEHFIIESIALEDEAGYTVAGWSEVEFLKVDGKWKINEFTYTSPEERSLDLTYNDLNCVETEAEILEETPCVLLDTVEKNGEKFIVYEDLIYGSEDSRNIIARNTKNSALNFELAETYR